MENFNNKGLPRLKTLGWSYDDDEDLIYYSIGYRVKYYKDYILWVQLSQEGVQDSLTIFFKKHIYFSDYGEEHLELDLYERAMAYQLSICHADPYGLNKRSELFKSMDLTAILTYLMKKRSIISLNLSARDKTLYGRIFLVEERGLALSLIDKYDLDDMGKEYISFDEILSLDLASGETLAMRALVYGLDPKDQEDFIEGHS